jgi:enoyl-CoA hydratase
MAIEVISRSNSVWHVRLNRPQVRNAIDQAMVTQLHQVCDQLEREPRVLMLSGGEGVFASGADIAELRQRGVADALRGINSGLFDRIAALPLPVIALVDGWALGGGAELALAADFRLATPRAVFGSPETALGIIPAAGALWRLRDAVGQGLTREMILAGRRLDAAQALAAGLVNAVYPADQLVQAGFELAGRIAKQDPLAVRLAKAAMAAPRAAHPLVDQLAQAVAFESPAKAQRMDAFLERRNP